MEVIYEIKSLGIGIEDTYMALLARRCSSCNRLPSAEEQRLCERALRSPSRSLRSRHRAISDSRHNIALPSHTIRTHYVLKPAPTPDVSFNNTTVFGIHTKYITSTNVSSLSTALILLFSRFSQAVILPIYTLVSIFNAVLTSVFC